MVVERKLAEEGILRRDLGREEFEKRVWQWKQQYGDNIKRQMIRLGASCDWSRERFTLDPGLSRAVREVFVRLYEKGLIYRGEYMVNWCPRCHTALSDLEVAHTDVSGHLWHIRYPVNGLEGRFVTVATTRPETMLGDTAVAINAKDARYLDLHGKTVQLPIMDREIPIILDDLADMEFGTGVVKVTPAHDLNDFEAGRRHNLPKIKVIDENARMTAAAGEYAGLDRLEARKEVVAALEKSGALVKVEDYKLSLGTCSRCKTPVEPLVSTQWFVKMKWWKTAASNSSRPTGPRPTTSGCTTSATGASRASSGGAIASPHGTVRSVMRRWWRAKRRQFARAAAPRNWCRIPTCSTPGSAPPCGRSPRSAGPKRPWIWPLITPRRCSSPASTSCFSGWPA
jgi:valyl-tRNA synthetase